MNISAILPAYNEELNIETTIYRLHKALLSIADNFEIIVIDDGSTDATEVIIRNLLSKYDSLKIVHHNDNKGYGCALRSGIDTALHDWLFIMDSDNQFDPEELKKITKGIDVESDALIGYRQNRQDSLTRIISSRIYNMLAQCLFGLEVKDINCAFKLLKRSSVSCLHIKARYYVVNMEILLKLRRLKGVIKEFPVTHYPRRYGRSKVMLKDIIRTLNELLMLKVGRM